MEFGVGGEGKVSLLFLNRRI